LKEQICKSTSITDNDEELNLFLDLLTKMLTYDATIRINSDEALNHPFFLTE